MRLQWMLAATVVLSLSATLRGWDIPADNGTLGRDAVAEILAENPYPETSGYRQAIEFVDFTANGQSFTQVVVTLVPDRPRLRNGRRIVVVGAEPGSEYGMDFVTTVEGRDGPAVWLAKRGITFVALTRVGRWNFLAPGGDGSWETIPIAERMPIFTRTQKAPWPPSEYETVRSGGTAGQTASVSASTRYPKKGTLLEKQMLAATPAVFVEGYRRALEHAITDRAGSFVLFWGMSTGGASLYPLAKHYRPDGFLGWGTSSTGLAYVNTRAEGGDFANVHDRMALRVRERGLEDFEFYTRHVDAETRGRWWRMALKSPRFKSTEDASMMFGVAGLTEHALRLWNADFLPPATRAQGLVAFLTAMLEPSFPPPELATVSVLDLNGTNDETLPPATVDANRRVMERYARTWRVGRIEGLHHYLFTQDSITVVGSVWLRYIDSGYFD
jgi:hypothetical protein